jgi:hypothetical protein
MGVGYSQGTAISSAEAPGLREYEMAPILVVEIFNNGRDAWAR